MRKIYIYILCLLTLVCTGCKNLPENKGTGENHSSELLYDQKEHDAHDHDSDSSLKALEEQPHEHGSATPEHSVIEIKKKDFELSVHTGGRILADKKSITIVTSNSSGIVKFTDRYLVPGAMVRTGGQLFTISGGQLPESNSELDLKLLKSDLDKASSDYERAKSLISDQIITQEHFLEVKNNYEKTLERYNNLNSATGSSGRVITSPAVGYIKEILVREGQLVTAGQPLVSVFEGNSLILEADLPPEYLELLSGIGRAEFTTSYGKKVYRTDEMNGRRISNAFTTGERSFYVPVYFRIDYDPGLIEGSYAEVYLISDVKKDAISVPNSALLEEYGKLYVFVEDEHGSFSKRYITTGNRNFQYTEVLSGLTEGEVIVSQGAYSIKLAGMTGAAPAHSHNH
jgi:RND family efflux transporter MFP subunit